MTYTIDIFNSNSAVSTTFVKANSFLLEKYFQDFQEVDSADKTRLLEKLWLAEYKAVLVNENNRWSKISFDKKNDHTMFLLKWS